MLSGRHSDSYGRCSSARQRWMDGWTDDGSTDEQTDRQTFGGGRSSWADVNSINWGKRERAEICQQEMKSPAASADSVFLRKVYN